jgi:hypothetical protein
MAIFMLVTMNWMIDSGPTICYMICSVKITPLVAKYV